MNTYLETLKDYITNHKHRLRIVGLAALGVAIVGIVIALFAYNNRVVTPDIVYQPVRACDLLTKSKAQEMLGNSVIAREGDQVIDDDGTATSKCSYTDTNSDQNAMKVVAVAVRSAINDDGARKNKADFTANQAANTVEEVTGVGDAAYFIPTNGQLYVQEGKTWMIFSYVVGLAPGADAREKTVELAHKLLPSHID